MNKFILDKQKCIGCKLCYKSCWLDVIRWDEEKKCPVGAYMKDCVECNYCEITCPKDALTIEIDYSRPFPSPYIPGKNS